MQKSRDEVVIDRATVADAEAVTAFVQRAYERDLTRMSIRPRPRARELGLPVVSEAVFYELTVG